SPYLRNVKASRIDDKAIFDKPMTIVTAAEIKMPGTISGSGSTLVVENTTDSALTTFAFANKGAKMSIAEQAFDLGGHHFAAGALVVANANRAALEPQ